MLHVGPQMGRSEPILFPMSARGGAALRKTKGLEFGVSLRPLYAGFGDGGAAPIAVLGKTVEWS